MDILFENRVKEFVCRLQRAYLVERDVQKVLSGMDENVEWIGTGQQESGRGISGAKRFFEQEYQLYPSPFDILEEEYDIKILDPRTAAVSEKLVIQESGQEAFFDKLKIRVTAVVREQNGELRVLQVHMSEGSRNQLEDEIFPRTMDLQHARALFRRLEEQEKLLKEKNENLNALMENVPGGVICCEYNEELNLLQYSQGFLNMFGYSREEMEQEFHNQFRRLIYPEDLESTWNSVQIQMAQGKTKKIEYRVRCRDGRLVTVLDHGQLVERDGKKYSTVF